MESRLLRLRELGGEIFDLRTAAAVLEFDQQVMMPAAGGEGRSRQLARLNRLAHELTVSDRLGELLRELEPYYRNCPPESDDFCLLRQWYRLYERQRRVPAEFVEEFSQRTGLAFNAWLQAREANDFHIFEPHLRRIFELRRDYSGFFAPYEQIYDPQLEEFEPGLTTAEVRRIFERLREEQVKLLRQIAQRPPIDPAPLAGVYPDAAQWELGLTAMRALGFDFRRGAAARAEHPFTTTFNLNDVRITTHIYEDNLLSALFSTLHETGHALYEQGVASALDRTVLGTGASLAVHESQSRLWENLIGRSREFLGWFYPELQKRFPEPLRRIPVATFYRLVNRVEPSPVRTEADEATYNLHIMLRFELEVALLEGRIETAELPGLWREKMREYLGILPADDREGVLQDVHWATGEIGYFPTYALGNLLSVQIFEAAKRALPELPQQLARGEFAPLREFLTARLYRHGAKFYPSELVWKVTGGPLDPQPYLDYLNRKYGELYAL